MGAADLAAGKAEVLVEALPYIRRFAGKVVVVKYGGNAMTMAGGAGRTDDLSTFAEDIVMLHSVGMKVVVVHGGGPQIGDLLQRLGMESRFVDGLRVTDAETLDVARMVLVGKVNREIVSSINMHGRLSVGVSGEDGALLHASARSPELGFVGDIEAVDPRLLTRLLDSGLGRVRLPSRPRCAGGWRSRCPCSPARSTPCPSRKCYRADPLAGARRSRARRD